LGDILEGGSRPVSILSALVLTFGLESRGLKKFSISLFATMLPEIVNAMIAFVSLGLPLYIGLSMRKCLIEKSFLAPGNQRSY